MVNDKLAYCSDLEKCKFMDGSIQANFSKSETRQSKLYFLDSFILCKQIILLALSN